VLQNVRSIEHSMETFPKNNHILTLAEIAGGVLIVFVKVMFGYTLRIYNTS